MIAEFLALPPTSQVELPKQITAYLTNMDRALNKLSKLDLKTYYKLSGVELTCTTVDLDGQILRFLNQKTTPNLPVCKAVQMSGSFPFGFKALRWQKDWGNYYVHFHDKKLVVNLAGHEFTDGGLLANFPIKYLDN